MLVPPERLPDAELEYRTKYQVTVQDRETHALLTNELFTVTCVDQTSLGLFFKVATRDKYLILLTGSWVVVARDTTYAAIFMDWTILNRYVQIDPHQEDKARAIFERIRDLTQQQYKLKAELKVLHGFDDTETKEEGAGAANKVPTAARAIEEVYENQRTLLVGDYSSKYLIPLADTCGPWSDAKGTPRNPGDVLLPSADWAWVDEWHVDRERPSVDPDGWQYAINWTGSWSPQRGVTTVVRRRRWIRERVLRPSVPVNEAAPANATGRAGDDAGDATSDSDEDDEDEDEDDRTTASSSTVHAAATTPQTILAPSPVLPSASAGGLGRAATSTQSVPALGSGESSGALASGPTASTSSMLLSAGTTFASRWGAWVLGSGSSSTVARATTASVTTTNTMATAGTTSAITPTAATTATKPPGTAAPVPSASVAGSTGDGKPGASARTATPAAVSAGGPAASAVTAPRRRRPKSSDWLVALLERLVWVLLALVVVSAVILYSQLSSLGVELDQLERAQRQVLGLS